MAETQEIIMTFDEQVAELLKEDFYACIVKVAGIETAEIVAAIEIFEAMLSFRLKAHPEFKEQLELLRQAREVTNNLEGKLKSKAHKRKTFQ